MKGLFDLNGRIAVVTGALGQLGRQYCMVLQSFGARVVALDLLSEGEPGEVLLRESLDSDRYLYVQCNITSRTNIEEALAKIQETWGTPQVLVNNAAIDSPPSAPPEENGPFEDYPEASLDKVLDVNLKGVVLTCQVFGSAMAKANKGSIINISSIYGILSPKQGIYDFLRSTGKPFFKPVAYALSKSAIVNLTRYLATYWAESNIRVNTMTLAGVFNHQDPRFLANYCPHVPMGRMANETEFNGALIYLASDASSYVTGSNLVIDGGWTAW